MTSGGKIPIYHGSQYLVTEVVLSKPRINVCLLNLGKFSDLTSSINYVLKLISTMTILIDKNFLVDGVFNCSIHVVCPLPFGNI